MELEQFIDDQIAECRAKFDNGDYRQLVQAFRWCTIHGKPLPDWVAAETLSALLFVLEKGGAPGKGKTGGYKKQIERDRIHRERHRVAAWQLHRRAIVGGNRDEAFERASQHLAGTFAQGSARGIEDSYNLIASDFATDN